MYFRKKASGGRVYLQIAESRRVAGQVRQRVIATLGRLDMLAASGQLERLRRSGVRFATQAMVLSAAQDNPTAAVRRIGPALVFERLWAETGCRAVIEDVATERKHGFALERAIFLTVLHRLMGGGSDLAADRWREDYRIAGAEALELHPLYRAMAWLGEELPEPEQDARVPLRADLGGRPWEPGTPFAPRCINDLVEERLFAHRRDLFSRLDLVFMDTTSLYFEGAGGQTLGRHGHSKDHRPDLRQMILAVLPSCEVEWHQGELYPRVGFIVTNLNRPPERVVKFYNGRGTAEQWIREGQERAPLDAALLPRVPAQRGAAPAARAGLQPRQLPTHLGAARGGRALVAHDAAREAGQDRRPDRAPRPLLRLPTGRGGGAAGAVRRDPAPDRSTQTKATPDMSDASNVSSNPQAKCARDPTNSPRNRRAVGSPCRGSGATTHPRPLSAFACCLMLPIGAFWPWYRRYLGNVGLARRPRLVVAVALANKMARIVCAVMTQGQNYRQAVPALVELACPVTLARERT